MLDRLTAVSAPAFEQVAAHRSESTVTERKEDGIVSVLLPPQQKPSHEACGHLVPRTPSQVVFRGPEMMGLQKQ